VCPLHRAGSDHAQTIELADCERHVSELAATCGVELTPNDHAIVSQFAQLLFERARAKREKNGEKP
jgi:hypothetical protein